MPHPNLLPWSEANHVVQESYPLLAGACWDLCCVPIAGFGVSCVKLRKHFPGNTPFGGNFLGQPTKTLLSPQWNEHNVGFMTKLIIKLISVEQPVELFHELAWNSTFLMDLLWTSPISLGWSGIVLTLTGWLGMKLSCRCTQETICELAFSAFLGVRGPQGYVFSCRLVNYGSKAWVLLIAQREGSPLLEGGLPCCPSHKDVNISISRFVWPMDRVESKIVIKKNFF